MHGFLGGTRGSGVMKGFRGGGGGWGGVFGDRRGWWEAGRSRVFAERPWVCPKKLSWPVLLNLVSTTKARKRQNQPCLTQNYLPQCGGRVDLVFWNLEFSLCVRGIGIRVVGGRLGEGGGGGGRVGEIGGDRVGGDKGGNRGDRVGGGVGMMGGGDGVAGDGWGGEWEAQGGGGYVVPEYPFWSTAASQGDRTVRKKRLNRKEKRLKSLWDPERLNREEKRLNRKEKRLNRKEKRPNRNQKRLKSLHRKQKRLKFWEVPVPKL